jgi:hypothetical protein
MCDTWKLRSEFGTKNEKPRYECHFCEAKISLVSNARKRAKQENIEESNWIDKHDLKQLMNGNESKCPIFGWPLQFAGNNVSRNSATLDAVIETKGHRKGNLELISFFANSIKNTGTPQSILQVGLSSYKNQS